MKGIIALILLNSLVGNCIWFVASIALENTSQTIAALVGIIISWLAVGIFAQVEKKERGQ